MKCLSVFFTGLIISFLSIFIVFAKDVKPKVLVYGDNLEAFAAAIQSARSDVPTLWVLPSSDFCLKCDFSSHQSIWKSSLVGGIWLNILQDVEGQDQKRDSIFDAAQRDLTSQILRTRMDSIMHKQHNLTILKYVKVNKITNKQKNVDVVLSNKRKLNVNAIVDATEEMDLMSMANIEGLSLKSRNPESSKYEGSIQDLGDDILRTLIAIGEVNNQLYGFTTKSILDRSLDNLFFTSTKWNPVLTESTVSTQLSLGQAVGASAAYCAFFKTTSDKIEVRKLQSELMSFDSRLIPFVDVSVEDPNFNALQRGFLSQILPWDRSQVPFLFNGSDSVSIESIKPVIQQLYSRAQLWFMDNKSIHFTVKDVIELIKVISYRSDELDEEVKKAWKKRFKFERDFQADNIVSRYEFIVLLDAYASPFVRRISLEGIILR